MTRILKIDKVNIELVNGKIRLRWTFKGQRLSFSIGDNSEQNLDIAKNKAYQINSDMGLERFNHDDYQSKKNVSTQQFYYETINERSTNSGCCGLV